ncbi:RteC domain-containing protein [Flavobacterium sp. xlx-214]|uniref:RteC domain-containing protein n=1 Tax=unclassified Flavobacterium TaxID=196869 RepID=UPI0013D2D243|nr:MULTISPECIES: RteC domain-containing protein [unclassified Flavobacterium]MBA5791569.1 RteC domain-containing protein [Flavobacterium sp. xlx-221]QMI82818.1 RteC domain-containing protein [Flavobacterium sp. xlx-214]
MEQRIYEDVLSRLITKEQRILLNSSSIIEESYQMTLFLKEMLGDLKQIIMVNGFTSEKDEITFFKQVKPQILGKLIFYNKLYRIETSCPASNGKLFVKYFSSQIDKLLRNCKEYTERSEFYRYYKSGRTDRDAYFFKLGNIDFYEGLNSVVFEIDPLFSTYYDYKIARFVSDDLLYNYLMTRLQPDDYNNTLCENQLQTIPKDLLWTNSKSALIELVYALHASGAISNGRIGISKIALLFEAMFSIKLGDLHHSFHRMKDRSGSKTSFLDQLTTNLEKYMHKDLD